MVHSDVRYCFNIVMFTREGSVTKQCEFLNQDSKLVTQFDLSDDGVFDDTDDNDDNTSQLFSASRGGLELVRAQNRQGEFEKVSRER